MCLTSVICLEGRTDQEDHLGNWFCDNDSLTVLICQTTSGQNRWVSGQTRCAKAEEGKEQNPTTRTEQVDRRADRQTVSEKTSRETRKRRMPHRDKPKQTRPKERPRCRAGLGFGFFFHPVLEGAAAQASTSLCRGQAGATTTTTTTTTRTTVPARVTTAAAQ